MKPAPTPADDDGIDIPDEARRGGTSISVEVDQDGARVTAVAPDRVGLLADLAAVLALQRAGIRTARAWSQDDYGVSVWEVADQDVDAAVLRQRYAAIVEGRLDAASRFAPRATDALDPTVVVRPEASDRSTVLEVRATDRPGVVHLVCAALAGLDLAVRSAHVDTLGPQAVDVFYIQESGAGALGDQRAAEAAHAVREALAG